MLCSSESIHQDRFTPHPSLQVPIHFGLNRPQLPFGDGIAAVVGAGNDESNLLNLGTSCADS